MMMNKTKLENAIKYFEREIRFCERSTAGNIAQPDDWVLALEANRAALAALREKQERENPKPLTLEELRQTKEPTPVWREDEYCGMLCLAQTGVVMVPSGICYDAKMLAGHLYRHKPQEVQHEDR